MSTLFSSMIINDDYKAVKGFKDFTGDEAKLRELIRNIVVNTYENYFFEPAETPIIEEKKFVKGDNEGDDAISEIYSLTDKGNRDLALRYEFTFQLKRLMQGKKLPYRRYSIGPVFRDEPVSSARLRQFTQCDVDVVGSTIRDEAEMLAITKEILDKIGIESVIQVNNRKLLNEILEKNKVKEKDKDQVIREIDKKDKLPKPELIERLKKLKAENVLKEFEKPMNEFEKYDAFKEIKELKEYCKLYNVEIEFTPFLARGLSYYNGTVFEVKTKKLKETICAGGSYIFNNTQSTGVSLGLERLCMLAKVKKNKKATMIIPFDNEDKAIEVASFLRKNDCPCFINSQKVAKAMKYVNSYNISFVIFTGDDEVKSKKYKIRDMESGKEETTSLNGILKFIKK